MQEGNGRKSLTEIKKNESNGMVAGGQGSASYVAAIRHRAGGYYPTGPPRNRRQRASYALNFERGGDRRHHRISLRNSDSDSTARIRFI
jgi:hypothetical protein